MCVCFTHSPSKLSNSRTLPEERWCCGLQWVSKSQTPWTDRTQQQETRQSNYISTVSHRQISPSRRRSEDVLFKLFWRRKQAMLRSVDAAVGQCSREQQRTTEEDHGSPDYCPTTGQPDVVWMDRRGSQKQDWTANSKANWRFPKYV